MSAPEATPTAPDLALAGLRVVEYAEGIAGPYAAKLLADMGAEVIKIEAPSVGDASRRQGPFPGHQPHPERSGLFLYLNTNKLGLTLNLEHPSAQEVFRQLVAQADVLIEDRPPGWLAQHEVGYVALRAVQPDLVMTSVTRFGQEGPEAHYQAYPLTTYHAGGEGYTLPGRLSLDLFPDREPVQAGGALGEYESGLCAAVATLGAVLSGMGQHLDVSQQEALLNINRPVLAHYLASGEVISRQRGYTFGGAMPCRDGYIMLRPMEDRHWQGLAKAMDRPELAEDERFRTRNARIEHGQALNQILLDWSMQHTKLTIYQRVAAEGCPVAYFATAEDIAQAPQLAARGFLVECCHPETGTVVMPSASYRMSATPWRLRYAAPRLGAHNEAILCGRLGYDRTALARWRAQGVI
jgi:crotonobetainyl-CoA:carnitine CoA-transferase CaiB-like acyl-CoA transferase